MNDANETKNILQKQEHNVSQKGVTSMSDKTELQRIAAEKNADFKKAAEEKRIAKLNCKLDGISSVFLKNIPLCDKLVELSDGDCRSVLAAVIKSKEFNDLFEIHLQDKLSRNKTKADKRKATIEANKATKADEEMQSCEEKLTDNLSVNNETTVVSEEEKSVGTTEAAYTENTENIGSVYRDNVYADSAEGVAVISEADISDVNVMPRATTAPSNYMNGSHI